MHPPVYCSSCGKPNAPDAKFCNECAKPMQQAPAIQTAQRRPIWWESQSKGIQATIVIGGLVFFFCVVNLLRPASNADRRPSTIPPVVVAPSKPLRSLSLEKYNRIDTGMKREEAEKVLGFTGTQTYDSRDRTGSLSNYTWREGEGASLCMVEITFINDKVHSKSQFGLE